MRTGVLAVVTALATAGSAYAADVQAIPPTTVEPAAALPPVEQNQASPFPCLFGCEQQAVIPPPEEAPVAAPEPEAPAARHARVRHAFVHAKAPDREGRSIATSRKVARPVSGRPNAGLPNPTKQTVVLRPTVSAPVETAPVKASPAASAPAAPASAPATPYGTLSRP